MKGAYLLNMHVILNPSTLPDLGYSCLCACLHQSKSADLSLCLSLSLHCPKPVILTKHVFLHGQARSASVRQNSCLLHIICALRASSGRWNPSRACGTHWGSHSYLEKNYIHMVLNRDGWGLPWICYPRAKNNWNLMFFLWDLHYKLSGLWYHTVLFQV